MSILHAILALMPVACLASGTHFNIEAKLRSAFTAKILNGLLSPDFVPASSSAMQALSTAAYSPTGFVYMMNSLGTAAAPDNTCSTISIVAGYPVDYCLVTSRYAMKVQIVTDSCSGAVVQYFGDASCKNFLGTTNIEPYVGCTYSNMFNGSYETLSCSTNPTPGIAGSWVHNEKFDTTHCTGTPEYIGWPTTCTYFDPVYMRGSCAIQGSPTISYYSDAACTVNTFNEIYSSQCYAPNDDEGEDDGSAAPPFVNPPPTISTTTFPTPPTLPPNQQSRPTAIVYCPAGAPSAQPASAPSPFPSSATPTVVQFDVQQNLYGVDAATFDASVNNGIVLSLTISQAMTYVSIQDVYNLTVVDAFRRRLASTDSVIMYYVVKLTTTRSAEQLADELENVITSGAFNTALFNNAALYGAPAVQSCTSNTVTITIYDDKNDDNGGSGGSDDLSVGVIVGIAVGGAAAAVLLIVLVYFLCARKAGPAMASQEVGGANRA